MPAAFNQNLDDDPTDDDGAEHAGDDADHERERESLDRAGAELIQDHTGDERSEVRVEDGSLERALVTRVDRSHQRLTRHGLLPDALENEHVRVDGDRHGQYNPGDARKRQRSLEPREDAEQEDNVE